MYQWFLKSLLQTRMFHCKTLEEIKKYIHRQNKVLVKMQCLHKRPEITHNSPLERMLDTLDFFCDPEF